MVPVLLAVLATPEVCNASRCWSAVQDTVVERDRRTGKVLQRWILRDIEVTRLTVSDDARYVTATNDKTRRTAIIDRMLVVVTYETRPPDRDPR